tara:strand:+ start:19832 stop:20239 length:408 start_codon:yes stop_codon:yes gene_type:complete
MDVYTKLLLSAGGATVATSVLLVGGYILEQFMNPKYATFIALVVSAAINFFLQKRTFAGKKEFKGITLWRYAVATVIITLLNFAGHSYALDHRKEYEKDLPDELHAYYTTITRSIVAVFIFLTVSFPLRKMWVFA